MSSIVFSCHVQHATPQIINLFSPHLEFITHDLRSTRTVIYNFVSANHLMGSLSPMFILPRNSPYTHYSHRVSQMLKKYRNVLKNTLFLELTMAIPKKW